MTQVIIKSGDFLTIFKWIRKNLNLGIRESKELAEKEIIDFYFDYDKALEFCEFLNNKGYVTELIHDYSNDNTINIYPPNVTNLSINSL